MSLTYIKSISMIDTYEDKVTEVKVLCWNLLENYIDIGNVGFVNASRVDFYNVVLTLSDGRVLTYKLSDLCKEITQLTWVLGIFSDCSIDCSIVCLVCYLDIEARLYELLKFEIGYTVDKIRKFHIPINGVLLTYLSALSGKKAIVYDDFNLIQVLLSDRDFLSFGVSTIKHLDDGVFKILSEDCVMTVRPTDVSKFRTLAAKYKLMRG